MNIERVDCPVCGRKNIIMQTLIDPTSNFYECPVCGRYEFSLENNESEHIDKNKLSAYLYYNGFRDGKSETIEHRYYTTKSKEACDRYIKENNGGKGQPVHIDRQIIDAWYPKTFAEKIDLILLNLSERTDYIGQKISMNVYEFYSCMFVKRYKDERNTILFDDEILKQAFFMTDCLTKMNFILENVHLSGDKEDNDSFVSYFQLTPKGYERIDKLQVSNAESKNVLVAMKFGNDTKKLREAIRKGIIEAEYHPVFIDEVEHNEFITPELLDWIRRSRFVVVDLTHQNNGAYFEEGYAMGLGKPVIQLCMDGKYLHFDIAQKNTIIWKTEEEIPLRLKNRIIATIGKNAII